MLSQTFNSMIFNDRLSDSRSTLSTCRNIFSIQNPWTSYVHFDLYATNFPNLIILKIKSLIQIYFLKILFWKSKFRCSERKILFQNWVSNKFHSKSNILWLWEFLAVDWKRNNALSCYLMWWMILLLSLAFNQMSFAEPNSKPVSMELLDGVL